MTLRQSNLAEHNEFLFNLWKRSTSKLSHAKIAETSDSVLVTIPNNGRPDIPVEFNLDELCV